MAVKATGATGNTSHSWGEENIACKLQLNFCLQSEQGHHGWPTGARATPSLSSILWRNIWCSHWAISHYRFIQSDRTQRWFLGFHFKCSLSPTFALSLSFFFSDIAFTISFPQMTSFSFNWLASFCFTKLALMSKDLQESLALYFSYSVCAWLLTIIIYSDPFQSQKFLLCDVMYVVAYVRCMCLCVSVAMGYRPRGEA